jgi:hypothetical protein
LPRPAADQCRHRHDHPQAVPEDDQALGLGKNLFDEMRYDDDGNEIPISC